MGRFMAADERSEAFERTVEVLKQLLESEGRDSVSRAYAEVVEPVARWDFRRDRKVASSSWPDGCVAPLFGEPHVDPEDVDGPWCRHCGAPGDHTEVLLTDNGAVFVSQPYELRWEALQQLVEWCKERGLRADLSAWESWHFPGRTAAVLITREKAPGAPARPGGRHGSRT